jgi:hypothetical protein
MPRRAKSAKVTVPGERPPALKGAKADDARVGDLEKRLGEALKGKAEARDQLHIRNRELTETLEQQTATSEILRSGHR